MDRLDKILAGTGRWSRREVKGLVRAGRVTVNGAVAGGPEQKYDRLGLDLRVDGAPIGAEKFVYLMLHKPGGVLSATEDPKQSTVVDLLPEYLRRVGLFPVGRLDKDTSGLLLVAKNDRAHVSLAEQIREHSVERAYLAICIGHFKEDMGVVDAPIGRHPTDRKKMAIREGGRRAVTHWRVLEELRGAS